MADVPLPATQRTVTVRVRSLVIAGVVAAAAGLLWWTGSWLTGMTPLSSGTTATAPYGLRIAQKGTLTGPPVYAWRRGGRYADVLWLHNSSSIPVTITGVDNTGPGWDGAFSGPTLALASDQGVLSYRPFMPLRIPADGGRMLAVVYHANPAACHSASLPGATGYAVSSTDSVTLHFSVLGVIHDTQTVPLGDGGFFLRYPTAAA